MGEFWRLRTQSDIEHFVRFAQDRLSSGGITVQIDRKARTSGQNGLYHVLAREVADQMGESYRDSLRYIKLHFGVPVLRESDDDFRELYDRAIKHNYTYEQKLEAMDVLPVTSRMNTKQMAKMFDAAIQHYLQNGIDVSHIGKGE